MFNHPVSGNGGFMSSLTLGALLGAGLGLLFAPKSGRELRGTLTEKMGSIKDKISQGLSKAEKFGHNNSAEFAGSDTL